MPKIDQATPERITKHTEEQTEIFLIFHKLILAEKNPVSADRSGFCMKKLLTDLSVAFFVIILFLRKVR